MELIRLHVVAGTGSPAGIGIAVLAKGSLVSNSTNYRF
jgi:hypothetical protein